MTLKTTHNLCITLLLSSSDLNACIPGTQRNRNGTGFVEERISQFTYEHKIFYDDFCAFPSLEIVTINRKASKVALQTDNKHTFKRCLFSSDKETEPKR